jgi:hypothetical protein
MKFKIITIDEYFSDYPEMKDDEWFNSCFNPKNDTGLLKKGILQFPLDSWAIGGGFVGNCSIYTIRDYRDCFTPKGRKKIETNEGYDYIDSPDMNDMIPFELLSIQTLISNEIESNHTSTYTYPQRFTAKYKECLLIKIGDTICQKSNFPPDLIPEIEKELTSIEWKFVLTKRHRLEWSIQSVSQEQPIKVRVSGIDDGAIEGLFETLAEAEKKLSFCSHVGFESPFFSTD